MSEEVELEAPDECRKWAEDFFSDDNEDFKDLNGLQQSAGALGYQAGYQRGKADAEKRIWEECCIDVAQQDKGRLYLHEIKQIIFGGGE